MTNDFTHDNIRKQGTRMPLFDTRLGLLKKEKSKHLIYVLYILYTIYIGYILYITYVCKVKSVCYINGTSFTSYIGEPM